MEEVAVEKLVVDGCEAHKPWVSSFFCCCCCSLYRLLIEEASHYDNKTPFYYQHKMQLRQHFKYKNHKSLRAALGRWEMQGAQYLPDI